MGREVKVKKRRIKIMEGLIKQYEEIKARPITLWCHMSPNVTSNDGNAQNTHIVYLK